MVKGLPVHSKNGLVSQFVLYLDNSLFFSVLFSKKKNVTKKQTEIEKTRSDAFGAAQGPVLAEWSHHWHRLPLPPAISLTPVLAPAALGAEACGASH